MTAEQDRIAEICGWPNDEYRWVEAYADGRKAPRGVIVGDFNNMSPEHRNKLERLGCELEWSDEGTECGDCELWTQTEPDSHSWRAEDYYHIHRGEILCAACWRTIWENEKEAARQRGIDAGIDAYDAGDLDFAGPVRLYLSRGMAEHRDELQALADAAAAEELRRLRAEGPPECSVCRGRHGLEVIHACE
jgi:hypothetical protein